MSGHPPIAGGGSLTRAGPGTSGQGPGAHARFVAFIADGKLLSAIMALLITLACAREMPPPGARPDEIPPSIVRIRPAPDSTVVDFDGALEIRFSEPVRIPNGLAREMFVTPMEVYEAETGFSDLRLRPEDGWRDSVVYCFTIPTDGINDLLRNGMEVPVEFCFSTGADIPEAMVEGEVVDALTAQPLEEARVIFWSGPDSVPYGAITDSVGRFAARGLPPGEYEAFGFVDRNRNLIPDRALESYDSASVAVSQDSLTELRFVVVAPDTTPPLLARALVVGSETVQLEFDDYLLNPQPEEPGIAIRDSATNEALEIVASLLGSADEVIFPSDSAALADSVAAADSAAVEDSTAVSDTVAVEAPSPDSAAAAASDSVAEEDPVLPSRFITVRLGAALDSGTYRVSVTGVVNVRGLAGGGDTSFVAEPEPPAEDSAAVADSAVVTDSAAVADSAAAEGDSLAVEQDSVPPAADTLDIPGVPPDTLGAPPDTLGAPPDTLGAPPDTVGVPPDTAGAPPDTVRRRP